MKGFIPKKKHICIYVYCNKIFSSSSNKTPHERVHSKDINVNIATRVSHRKDTKQHMKGFTKETMAQSKAGKMHPWNMVTNCVQNVNYFRNFRFFL